MDGSIEILLPLNSDLSPFNFETPIYELDGVSYPKGPPECNFGLNFKLKFVEKRNFAQIEKHMSADYKKINWNVIEILGEGLDIFIASLYGLREEEKGYTLQDLVHLLLHKKEKWMVIFSYQYDGFTEVMKSTEEEVIIRFEHAIKTSVKGFMLHSQKYF